jgi:hypothetical protein
VFVILSPAVVCLDAESSLCISQRDHLFALVQKLHLHYAQRDVAQVQRRLEDAREKDRTTDLLNSSIARSNFANVQIRCQTEINRRALTQLPHSLEQLSRKRDDMDVHVNPTTSVVHPVDKKVVLLALIRSISQCSISSKLAVASDANNDVDIALSGVKMLWIRDNVSSLLKSSTSCRIVIFSTSRKALYLVHVMLMQNGLGRDEVGLFCGDVTVHERESNVRCFQNAAGRMRVLLMTLSSGALGLNLTRGNVVIFIDPWYNPAVQHQAVKRIHRIGQSQACKAYFLQTVMTGFNLDEWIQSNANRKHLATLAHLRSDVEKLNVMQHSQPAFFDKTSKKHNSAAISRPSTGVRNLSIGVSADGMSSRTIDNWKSTAEDITAFHQLQNCLHDILTSSTPLPVMGVRMPVVSTPVISNDSVLDAIQNEPRSSCINTRDHTYSQHDTPLERPTSLNTTSVDDGFKFVVPQPHCTTLHVNQALRMLVPQSEKNDTTNSNLISAMRYPMKCSILASTRRKRVRWDKDVDDAYCKKAKNERTRWEVECPKSNSRCSVPSVSHTHHVEEAHRRASSVSSTDNDGTQRPQAQQEKVPSVAIENTGSATSSPPHVATAPVCKPIVYDLLGQLSSLSKQIDYQWKSSCTAPVIFTDLHPDEMTSMLTHLHQSMQTHL